MIEPYYQADRVTLYLGDCIEVMRQLPEASVDAIVTDPPYGLEFMGKDWDRLSVDPDIGKRRATGFEDASGRPDQREGNKGGTWFGSRDATTPNYYRTTNAKCRKCGRWRVSGGHDGKGNTLGCKCEAPDFPNVNADAARQMQAWHEAWAREAYRVLKRGGYLLAFGGTRTYHRLASGVEDAGFEVRDTLAWMYGSGFPKSLDVSKAIDKAAGAEREVTRPGVVKRDGYGDDWDTGSSESRPRFDKPATDAAKQWQGWGTALKPAYEPIVMARKPLAGTVAANVQRWGTGAINIDGTRIGTEGPPSNRFTDGMKPFGQGAGHAYETTAPTSGRWPANVILGCACEGPGHDAECAVALLDAQAGERGAFAQATGPTRVSGSSSGSMAGAFNGTAAPAPFYGDRGGASRFYHIARWTAEDEFGVEVVRRFYYTAKASRSEREAGLDGLPPALRTDGREAGGPGGDNPRLRVSERHNDHPTVKPIALMRWLVTMVTPPGGLVLDPFLGSGTTVLAALDVPGIKAAGIDMTERYVEIARYRVTHRHVLAPETKEATMAVPQGRLM